MAEIPARDMTPADWDRTLAAMQAAQAPPLLPQPAQASMSEGIDWPPGNAGALAQLLYSSAIRPVKEVAIATALGILAGVCGKAWNTYTDAGLNLYVVLVARSGIGKEAIGDGIAMMVMASLQEGGMAAPDFFTFDTVASGAALIKLFQDRASLLHISGEFGHTIMLMATDKTGPHASLRQQMTKLYSKSGATSIAGGIIYSDQSNNAAIRGSVAYSLIGETTPGTFFEALNGSMMADGFMSRFLVIDYDGPRPPENEARATPTKACGEWFAMLTTAARHKGQERPTPVAPDDDARALLREFSLKCDAAINANEDESRRQMWNRAHLKALKVASLLAVADNHVIPRLTAAQAQWAIGLVEHEIGNMTRRMDNGDVGDGDEVRRRKVLACLRDWLTRELRDSDKDRKGWQAMQANSIVPRYYLTNRLQRTAVFYNHRLGANAAIEQILVSLARDGNLQPLDKAKLNDAYGFLGEAYRVLKLD